MPRTTAVSPDLFTSFGQLLKHLRRRAGLTQRELSIAVGYSDTQISRLEKDQRIPDAAALTARFVPALLLAHEPAWTARLLELAETARAIAAPAAPATVPLAVDRPAGATNLPEPLTRFIGRETELAGIRRRLAEQRLVTLTGPGGTGKTRLALHAAAGLASGFPDGVFQVEFAPVGSDVLVVQAVATVLGTREDPGRPLLSTLLDYLRPRTLLLIFDNCEHLIDACAQAAEAILQACPHVRILATSLERLAIPGEAVFPVPTLSLPPPGAGTILETVRNSEAAQLFADRASMALPGFTLDEQNAAAVAQLCVQLDGIPLALELAAARVPMLSVAQIAARLGDRFQLLTGGSRTALPRHQTLSALIDWSYNLLDEPARALLRRLSVLRGSWTLEAAQAVGDSADLALFLDSLTQLIDKSLVIAEPNPDGDARYRQLETIRQFAWDRLVEHGESDEARGCHLDFYLALAQAAEEPLHRAEQKNWLARLEAENDNLRAALKWSLANPDKGDQPLRFAAALFWFWYIRGYTDEAGRWLEAALRQPGGGEAGLSRAWALNAAAGLAHKAGDESQAMALLEESIRLFRQADAAGGRGLGHALLTLGEVAVFVPDVGPAAPLFIEAEMLLREAGDTWGVALALHWQGAMNDPIHIGALSQRQAGVLTAATSQALYQASLDLFRQLGDRWAQTMPLGSQGNLAFFQGDRETGRALFQGCLAISREFGDDLGVAWALWALGNDALDQEDFDQAEALYEGSLALYGPVGHKRGMSSLLGDLAEVARRQNDLERAASLNQQSLVMRRELGSPERTAYSLAGLGRLAWSRGDYAQARALQTEALAIRRQLQNSLGLADSVEAFGILAALEGQAARAARLFAASQPFLVALCYSVLPIWRAERERCLAAARAQLSQSDFAAAWAGGQGMTLEEAVAFCVGSESGGEVS